MAEFLDTNILAYAASGLPSDQVKMGAARQLTERAGMAISLQVLQEFYNVARNPKKLNFTHDEACSWCNRWRRLIVLEPTLPLFDRSLELCDRFQISFYDAAILAAAHELRCPVVYSEDLNDGQDYGGVRVMNPFKEL